MPDISLRFHRDMLVLSAPVAAALARQGFDASLDLEYANMVEPEAVRDALRLNQIAGVQCLVANTAGITPARLAHRGLEERAPEVAGAALEAARQLAPQHLLAEVGPCGLPLDPSSKSSLNENRDQYARAARACAGQELDALFLNGFANPTDLKCALMGVRQVSDVAVFASVDVRADGLLADGRNPFDEALGVMADFGASVAGFATRAPLERAEAFARMAAGVGLLPVLAQLTVTEHAPRQGAATPENPYYCPDVLVDAGVRLRAAGAQFLRAAGKATPAYAGALVAASAGLDVVPPGRGGRERHGGPGAQKTRCAAPITGRSKTWWTPCSPMRGRSPSAVWTWSWPPSRRTFPMTWRRSSRCSLRAPTRASACATN